MSTGRVGSLFQPGLTSSTRRFMRSFLTLISFLVFLSLSCATAPVPIDREPPPAGTRENLEDTKKKEYYFLLVGGTYTDTETWLENFNKQWEESDSLPLNSQVWRLPTMNDLMGIEYQCAENAKEVAELGLGYEYAPRCQPIWTNVLVGGCGVIPPYEDIHQVFYPFQGKLRTALRKNSYDIVIVRDRRPWRLALSPPLGKLLPRHSSPTPCPIPLVFILNENWG